MGTDKALLEVDGAALAVRVASAALAVCGSVSLVGDPARYSPLGFPVAPDEFPGQGPLAGIEAALGATRCDWNLILACDLPALDAATLESLFSALETPVPADVAIPRYSDGKLEPLCAVYHRRCRAAIRQALESGIRKVTDALSGLAIRYVPVTRDEAFTNLNTPDDLRRFRNA